MKIILIDNVNNLSGAPMVAKSIASILHAPIYSLRQASQPCYNSNGYGIQSNKRRHYFTGILIILFNAKFSLDFLAAKLVVCNTSLTFPFAILARLLGKKTICVIHESSPKNLLYRVSIYFAKKMGNIIVTPSRFAYSYIGIPEHKWRVIPNALPPEYLKDMTSVSSESNNIYILFAGGKREYKGGPLFRELASLARKSNPTLHFHAAGEDDFVQYTGSDSRLSPEIYRKYHLVLVLTDNNIWKETFGLIGCEAAASRCIPLFTDRFAYKELWSEYSSNLLLPTYEAASILSHLEKLLIDRQAFDALRDSVRTHAMNIAADSVVDKSWKELVF